MSLIVPSFSTAILTPSSAMATPPSPSTTFEVNNEDLPVAPRTSLLDLPAEIRNRIYHNVLIVDEPIVLKLIHPFIVEPALLHTAKQVRNEALAVFYGANVFASPERKTTVLFLEQFGVERLSLLRYLRVISDAVGHISISELVRSGKLSENYLHMGASAGQAVARLCLKRIRVVGKELRKIGKGQGVRKEAMLLPIYVPNAVLCPEPKWATIDVHTEYKVERRDGQVMVVRRGE